MFEMSGDLKTLIDIGLGAVSLLLWLRQGKVNKTQAETNQKLVTMVQDHEGRIAKLETIPPSRRRRKR